MSESTGNLRCICGDLKSEHFTFPIDGCMVEECRCLKFHADLGTDRSPVYGYAPATDPGPAQRTEADTTGRGARPLVENVTMMKLQDQVDLNYAEKIVALRGAGRVWEERAKALAESIATLRNRAEDAEAVALALNARVDALVAREKEAMWLLHYKNSTYYRTNWDPTTANETDWLARRAEWLEAGKEATEC